MQTILLHTITTDEFYDRLRSVIQEELKKVLQQDQLLTREGACKMIGISNATLMKAIKAGIVKPQIVKGRNKAMYFESEILKIEAGRRRPRTATALSGLSESPE
jgi:hypothetical protein